MHSATASYIGADSINARLVDFFQVREDLVLSAQPAAEIVDADAESGEDTETPAP